MNWPITAISSWSLLNSCISHLTLLKYSSLNCKWHLHSQHPFWKSLSNSSLSLTSTGLSSISISSVPSTMAMLADGVIKGSSVSSSSVSSFCCCSCSSSCCCWWKCSCSGVKICSGVSNSCGASSSSSSSSSSVSCCSPLLASVGWLVLLWFLSSMMKMNVYLWVSKNECYLNIHCSSEYDYGLPRLHWAGE